MKKKFRLTAETITTNSYSARLGQTTEVTLHRIEALRDIPKHGVKKGDLGGWVEKEENLDHLGSCWIGENARVEDKARVESDALVAGNALVVMNALVTGEARVGGTAILKENCTVRGHSVVGEKAVISGSANIFEKSFVTGHAMVSGNAVVSDSTVKGDALVNGNAKIAEGAIIIDGFIRGEVIVKGGAELHGPYLLYDGCICKSQDVILVGAIGSRNSYTTFNLTSGTVATGCFHGTIEEFEHRVRVFHKERKQHLKRYLALVEYFKKERTLYRNKYEDRHLFSCKEFMNWLKSW